MSSPIMEKPSFSRTSKNIVEAEIDGISEGGPSRLTADIQER
jgi:hypothetical protein